VEYGPENSAFLAIAFFSLLAQVIFRLRSFSNGKNFRAGCIASHSEFFGALYSFLGIRAFRINAFTEYSD
jgi:hypothetical protein